MSIQEKTYTSKKTGKSTTHYCAVVYDTNSKKYIWSKRCETKKEARKCERELIEDLEKGQYDCTKKKKEFNELATNWLEVAKTRYATSTFRGYEWYTKTYILPVFGEKKLSVITPLHIQKFVTVMAEKYSAETVNKTINILSNIYQFGTSLNIINANPCENIKRLKVGKPKHITWSEHEIMYFLNLPIVRLSPYHDMFILLFSTGLRPSEICGISEKDLVNSNVLSVKRGYNKYGTITDLKTESSQRPIELSNQLARLLEKRLEYKKHLRLYNQDSSEFVDNDFLFTLSNGRPISPNLLSEKFRLLIRKHNEEINTITIEKGFTPKGALILPQIRLYDARHSFATNSILSNNASIKVIAEILGHSNVKTTLHNYSHVSQSMSKKVIDDYSNRICGELNI